jgi:DnaJ-domain-containing protein 1
MGQIFNRIKRIAGSYFSDINEAERFISSEDDELKRIIDELNNPKKNGSSNKSHNQENFNSKQSYNSNNNTNSIPQNVINAFNVIGLQPNADIDLIKMTFKKKIKENHPDKFTNSSEEVKKNVQIKSQEIINAYNVIKAYKGF